MCGFAGVISNSDLSSSSLEAMGLKIKHRGPDQFGISIDTIKDKQVGLVHRRLSILDLSVAGKQPMKSTDGNYTIVFNGEVYNFKELREEFLEGENFNSNSDTEVILKLYQKYDMEFVSLLTGMFSIVILDKKKQQIILIRDRIGVKPLYFGVKDGEFLFGSELKALLGDKQFKLNPESVQLFLQYGYIPGKYSIYDEFEKVKPGTYITVDIESLEITYSTYWDLKNIFNTNASVENNGNEKKNLTTLLKKGFSYRMVSDVPVGVFLSGGYDSTLLTGILSNEVNNLQTFTIGFEDDSIDESKEAKLISDHFGTTHHEFQCTSMEALHYVDQLPFYFDEPFGDPSAIPTMMVSERASKKVKVVLSADGGDEIFAGYDKHKWALRIFNLSKSWKGKLLKITLPIIIANSNFLKLFYKDFKNLKGRLKKIQHLLGEKSLVDILDGISKYIPDEEIELWVKSVYGNYRFSQFEPSSGSELGKMLAVDLQTHLPDQIMTKVDRATMSASIEGREPLLDHKIIEYGLRLGDNFKIRPEGGKLILKEIVWDMISKSQIERPKKGFVIPLKEWLKGPLAPLLNEFVSKEKLSNKIFHVDYILEFKERFFKGEDINERKLWHVLMFQLWLDKWKENIDLESY